MIFLPMTEEQKNTLREKGINFNVFSNEGEPGGLLPDEGCRSALDALGLVVESNGRTSYEGIRRIYAIPRGAVAAPPVIRKARVRKPKAPPALIPPPERPVPAQVFPVTAYAWEDQFSRPGGKELMIMDVKEILSPVVGKKIKVSAAYGRPRTYITQPEGSVGLHLGEGDQLGEILVNGSTLLGVQICRNYQLLSPTPDEGITLAEDEGQGVAYAQIMPEQGQVWILLDVGLHGCSADERLLFQKILREVAAQWVLSPEQREERDARRRLARRPVTKAAYARACSQRLKRAAEQVQTTLSRGEATLRTLEQQLVTVHREIADARRRLPQLEEQIGKEVEVYSTEFDKLLSTPHVVDVDIVGTRIRVFTDVLYCVDPRSKKKHEIGKFRIEISLGEAPLVSWFNLSRQVHGYQGRKMQAPHVFPDGHACLGNMEEVFPSMVAAYEFAAAAQVAIAFVQQVNADDTAGSYISRWPEAQVKTGAATSAEPPIASPSVGEATVSELRAERGEEEHEDAEDDDREDVEDEMLESA